MKIEVTQKHIDEGEQRKCELCPAALAIRDATGGMARAEIVHLVWRDQDASERWMYTPDSVRDFMRRFDLGLHVEPFEFELEAA